MPEFHHGYRDNHDLFVAEQQRMLAVLQSLYAAFVKDGSPKAMLDLGCGDGIVTAAIVGTDPTVSVTLVDDSTRMLERARERLAGLDNVRCILADFEDILLAHTITGTYDFVASSLALHRLMLGDKKSLFQYIYDHLRPDGYFVILDIVLAPSDRLERWYFSLWREWMTEHDRFAGLGEEEIEKTINSFKDNNCNKPDTLNIQLEMLRFAGFVDVDCYFKYGMFALFGGRKPEAQETPI